MKSTQYVTWSQVYALARNVMQCTLPKLPKKQHYLVYGVPRGGIYAAQAFCDVAKEHTQQKRITFEITEEHQKADVIVDDIEDSGNTRLRYQRFLTAPFNIPFVSLLQAKPSTWYVFPWETQTNELGPEENIVRILQYIGEDPEREGLKETPTRVVKSYSEIFAGYKQNPAEVMKVFEDGSCNEMVVLKDIEFYSVCEHHMQPFFGKAHVAYLPAGRVIGVSKLARVLDIYSRRLQIQERLTQQVTNALMEHLKPNGAACVIEAKHFCMVCRGVGKQNSTMITSSLEGAFKNDSTTRNEFFSIIKG